ncbi:DUF692 domain-containing protein [Dyella sp. C11]|uniref:MNIO family bufferin maturase n=1 Tax=Dyella sp. C11 TaxID=2126991 RepID=UPI000D652C14|nr:DUF692 domain-containing protein [Dyella sp. C11]
MKTISDLSSHGSALPLWPPGGTPLCAGVGLKPVHYRSILEQRPGVGFFEIHAENYMGEGGPPHRYLSAIREHYTLSVHGVGLSLGASHPLDEAHLQRLKVLIDRYQPMFFSEHLAWSTHASGYLNDLLPLPYTAETLHRVVEHIDATQTFLGRRLLLENPSTYVRFTESTYAEPDFIQEIVRRTSCGVLLDVNNVHVSAINHGFDPYAYIDAIHPSSVGEIHLAGHTHEWDEDGSPLLIDTHDQNVSDAVWSLYAHAIRRMGAVPTMIEWDTRIPGLDVLVAESQLANAVARAAQEKVHV